MVLGILMAIVLISLGKIAATYNLAGQIEIDDVLVGLLALLAIFFG